MRMPAFYDSTVATFITDDRDRIIGCLIAGENNEGFAQYFNRQTYALDLSDFHAQSHIRTIVPILIATQAPLITPHVVKSDNVALPINVTNAVGLSSAITSKYQELHQ